MRSPAFTLRSYAVLATLSRSYPPSMGMFRCITHPFATRRQGCPRAAVRLACVKHAASVQSEPGSNSIVQSNWSPRIAPQHCSPELRISPFLLLSVQLHLSRDSQTPTLIGFHSFKEPDPETLRFHIVGCSSSAESIFLHNLYFLVKRAVFAETLKPLTCLVFPVSTSLDLRSQARFEAAKR